MTDAWGVLRHLTQARIALGRSGHALPTKAQLDLQLAHAEARDAVQLPWAIDSFAGQLRELDQEVLILDTPVSSRDQYLRRPDLGRLLAEESRVRLLGRSVRETDVALIVTNGLSSTAVERHGISLVQAIVAGYRARHISLAPICLVTNGRVALSDAIGNLLSARVAVIIVGERPGLSSADSLGIYLTFRPQAGNSDAQRNCISNIRPPDGLGYEAAAAKLIYLTGEALRRGLSGVALKDEMGELLASGKAEGIGSIGM